MLNQIQLLETKLKEIGFEIEAHENVLQIISIDNDVIDLQKASHAIQVVIELDDPFSCGNKFIFQNCSLKVYYEGWELQELAKIIKFNIAAILDENGIFNGMGFEFPKSHEEVLVP